MTTATTMQSLEAKRRSALQTVTALLLLAIALTCTTSPLYAEFQKSPNDPREYLAFELENQMKVLVVSDPETDIASASMSIRVGGGSDYEDWPGIAHFLEHMLFLGSEKYPELDGFRDFVERNGGSTNAFTSVDQTNYRFSIGPTLLRPALDRFAHNFIAPLFHSDSIDRERGVVDAEFQMRIQNDSVQRWSVFNEIFNPDHPASKFISGNEETLAGDIRNDLIQFHREFYSANLMALVVIGQEPVSELKDLVVELFSPVENSGAEIPNTDEPLFLEGTLPTVVFFNSIINDPSLTLIFPVMHLQPYWKQKPANYVSYIIGHEGEGSLLSELKNRGWANELYAGPGFDAYESSTFSINITLTEIGYRDWEAIPAVVFQYIREIQKRGVESWRFNEIKILSELDYQFTETTNESHFATTMAEVLHRYPANELFPAIHLVQHYDPDLIADLLEQLIPENVLITVAAPDVPTNAVTPESEAEYSVSEVSKAIQAIWKLDIADSKGWLPSSNEFLPENLSLTSDEGTNVPQQVLSQPGFELWHQTDTSFRQPKAGFFVSVRSQAAKFTARNRALLRLYVEGVNDLLTEFSYSALMAGLNYSMYPHSRGFSVRVSGYNDNQEALLRRIMEVATKPEFLPDRFEQHRDKLIQEIENDNKDDSYVQAIEEIFAMLSEQYWTDEEILDELNKVTIEDLQQYVSEYFKQIDVVALSHGNVSVNEARLRGQIVVDAVFQTAQPSNVEKSGVAIVPEIQYVRRIGVDHDDSASIVYVQGAARSIEERINFNLLSQIIGSAFFTELRTKQELGYIVYAGHLPLGGIPGISFVIQSPDFKPHELTARTIDFLSTFHDELTQMSDEEFEAHRNGLHSRIVAKEETLGQRTSRYWRELDDKEYQFDVRARLADALVNLDRNSFEQFVFDLVGNGGMQRIAIEAYSDDQDLAALEAPTYGKLMESTNDIKSSGNFFANL